MKKSFFYRYNFKHIILFFVLASCWNGNSQETIGNDILGPEDGSQFGLSVAMNEDGTILAASAPFYDNNFTNDGLVQMYKFESGSWSKMGNDIYGLMGNEQSGNAIAISNNGTRVVIGSHRGSINLTHEGHVRVMEWNGTIWQQMGATIFGVSSTNYSGSSVAMNGDGTRIVIGSPNNSDNGTVSGHIRIFEWSGTEWIMMGAALTGDFEYDTFGEAVSMNDLGNRLVVSAPGYDLPEENNGLIRVYEWSGMEWIQMGNNIYGSFNGFLLGTSLEFNNNGTRFVTSGNNGSSLGYVQVFNWDGSQWEQFGNDIIAENAADHFGFGLSFNGSGNRLALGAYFDQTNGTNSGMAQFYEFNGNDWIQFGETMLGDAPFNIFGYTVSLNDDGTRLAIGAAGNNNSIGLVRVFDPTILSIEENELKNLISVFPNPISDYLNINNYKNLTISSILFYNINGKLMHEYNKNSDDSIITLKVTNLNSGIYTLVVNTEQGRATFKLLKK